MKYYIFQSQNQIACLFQFIIEPKGLEKEVKIQLPILLATYPFRDEDSEPRKEGTHYPTTLPIFRPWLEEKSVKNV